MFPLNGSDMIFARAERGGCGLKHNFMMIEIANGTAARAHRGMSQDIGPLSFATIAGAGAGRPALTTRRHAYFCDGTKRVITA